MTAFEYLKSLPCLPASKEGRKYGRPSNSEMRRWLEKGSVIINGVKPSPNDEINPPIKELIFFPKGKNRTTML